MAADVGQRARRAAASRAAGPARRGRRDGGRGADHAAGASAAGAARRGSYGSSSGEQQR